MLLLLGLLLLCGTAAFTGLLIADNLSGGPDYSVTILGNTIATMNSLEIFLSGLALALIFCFALALMGIGGRLSSRRRALLRSSHGAHAATPHATTARADTDVAVDEETGTPAGTAAGTPARSHRPHRHLFGH